jgi:1-deoxy-D-xylulose-5-phosphate reductoisomerase
MGQKISVDSATMMNKGLEVIEAAWMFDLGPAQIDVLIHPQVAVHGLVYFNDGSVIGQLGTADMKTPISVALAWPDRLDWKPEPLDLLSLGSLDFMAVEEARYPCFFLARQALASGGIMPAVLNAANEVAVAAFLDGRIGFTGIGAIVDDCLQNAPDGDVRSLEAVLEIDARTRRLAETRCESYMSGASMAKTRGGI